MLQPSEALVSLGFGDGSVTWGVNVLFCLVEMCIARIVIKSCFL